MRIPRSLGYVLKIALVMCFYTFALWVLFRVLASVTKPKKNRVLVDGEEDYLFDESDAEDETLLEHVAGNYVDLLRISKILDRRNSTEDYSLRMPSDVDLSEHKQSSALLQLLNAKVIPRSLGYVLKIALVMCFYTFALWVLFRVLASVTKPKKNRVLVDGEEDYLFDESDAEDETLLEHVAGNYVDLLRISKILDRRNSTEDYSLRMPSDVDLSEHKQSSALLQLLNAKMNMTIVRSGIFRIESMSSLHGYNIGDFDPEKHDQETVECYPIFDVLSAAKLTQLDVLMLDVQGAEEDILRTIPWRLVDIRVILVEISKFGKSHLPRKLFHQEQRLKAFLGKQGYDVKAVLGRDFIFVRE
ncbi:unnamed protein product [Notodromas monacha]|uniref:Methyltransferase FkbM domain-containing protein n=1 Tax=Notodromas monacha TaxID=399045 RepID=A0A7R9GDH7_9CRUS|nr:unnamed protein product [Notodromas monacha]CAG0917207.1 unnamed protein product [Notodromas monacha]